MVSRALNVPIPGPVIGMALLFIVLLVRRGIPEPLEHTGNGLLRVLSLLFVPAGVGVMQHLDLIAASWVSIAITIVASTAITMLVTAGVMHGVQRLVDRRSP